MKRLKVSLDDQSIYVRISDRAAEDLAEILKILPLESDLEVALALIAALLRKRIAHSHKGPQILLLDR